MSGLATGASAAGASVSAAAASTSAAAALSLSSPGFFDTPFVLAPPFAPASRGDSTLSSSSTTAAGAPADAATRAASIFAC